MTNLPPEQHDFHFWEQAITDAVQEPDPVVSNLKITRCHYLLSVALQQVLGPNAGANFHTWAVWGSRKAGVTIRQEDLDQASRDGTMVGGIVGGLVGLGLGWVLHDWLTWLIIPAIAVLGIICGALTGRYVIVRSRRVSASLILHGNRIVLQDIGLISAKFITRFHDLQAANPEKLAAFLDELQPGETAVGGQDLLRHAFAQYYSARFTTDLQQKHEAVYLANCLAVFHEHIRLEPFIRGSMPWIISRCVTQRLLQYDVGSVRLTVAHDVPALEGMPFPDSLCELKNQELVAYLSSRIGSNLDALTTSGTGAKDWTQIRQRMRYVVNLFRVMHLDAVVFEAPYNTAQFATIANGTRPAGPL